MATNPGTLQLTEEEFPLESSAHSTPKQVKPNIFQVKIIKTLIPKTWYHLVCLKGRESTLGQCPAQSSLANDSLSQLSSSSHITRSPARNPMNFRTMQVRVTLLDGSLFTCTVEVRGWKSRKMISEIMNKSVSNPDHEEVWGVNRVNRDWLITDE